MVAQTISAAFVVNTTTEVSIKSSTFVGAMRKMRLYRLRQAVSSVPV